MIDAFGPRLKHAPVPIQESLPRRAVAGLPTWLSGATPQPAEAKTHPLPSDAAAQASVSEAALREQRTQAEREAMKAAQVQVESLMQRYLSGIGELEAMRQRLYDAYASEVVPMALLIAREVLGRELTIDPNAILESIDRALRILGLDAPIRIRLRQTEIAYVLAKRPELLEAGIEFIEDETLELGGCIVEGARQVVDGSIASRLEVVGKALTEELTPEGNLT